MQLTFSESPEFTRLLNKYCSTDYLKYNKAVNIDGSEADFIGFAYVDMPSGVIKYNTSAGLSTMRNFRVVNRQGEFKVIPYGVAR